MIESAFELPTLWRRELRMQPCQLSPFDHLRRKLTEEPNANHNRSIPWMVVIEELIRLAKEMDAATKRGVDLGLTDDEVAFYDALATNDSAVQAMGDAKLRLIASELITQCQRLRENRQNLPV